VRPTVTPVPAPTGHSAPAGLYQDGTYTGSGTSRRGGVTVEVTIQGGRIANVAITRCSTEYPQSRIDGLPAQVVQKQSAQVNRISGATYSWQAFTGAVQQALAQAKA
jgi:uncharacterized protein with FMN-binding domain